MTSHVQKQSKVMPTLKNQAEFQDFIICGLLPPEHWTLYYLITNIHQSLTALSSGLLRNSPGWKGFPWCRANGIWSKLLLVPISVSLLLFCYIFSILHINGVDNPLTNTGDMGSILSLEDPLVKEMATHSSIVAWRNPWTEESGRPQSMGVTKSWTGLSNWACKEQVLLGTCY